MQDNMNFENNNNQQPVEMPKIDDPVTVEDPFKNEQPVLKRRYVEEFVVNPSQPVTSTTTTNNSVEEPKTDMDKLKSAVDKKKRKIKKKHLTKEEKKYRKILKKGKRHYWWRYLFVFIAGILFPFVLIAGAVTVASTVFTSGQLVTLFGGNPEDYITEDYQDKTIFQFVVECVNGDITFENLQSIRNITPYIDVLVDSVNAELENAIGFTFDKEELYQVNFNEIGNYIFMELQDGIELATILGVNEHSSSVLIYLAYETTADGQTDWNNPRSLGDIMNNMDDIINNARIGDLIDVGTSGILYNLRNVKVGEMAESVNNMPLNQLIDIPNDAFPALVYLGNYSVNQLDEALDNATLGDLLDVGTEGILYNLRDVKINDIADEMNSMPLNQIIDISEDAFPALKYLGKYSVSELETALNNATVGDLLDVGTEGILYNLRNIKINNLSTEMQNMPLNQLIDINSDDFPALVYLGNYSVSNLNDALNNATLGDLIEIDENSILYELRDTKINDLSEEIKNQPLGNFIQIDENSSKVLQYLKNTPISDINDAIQNMPLDCVIEIDENSPQFLKALVEKGATISNMSTLIETLTIGDAVEIDENSNSILQYLKNVEITNLNDAIQNMPLADALAIDENSPHFLKSLAEKGATLSNVNSLIDTLTLGDAIEIDENSSAILKYLKNTPITNINDAILTMPLDCAIEIDENSPKFLRSLVEKGATITNVGDIMETLTFADMIDVGDSLILNALADSTMSTLGEDINNLTIGDMIDVNDPNTPKLLKSLANTKINDLGDAIHSLKIEDIIDIDENSPMILKALVGTNFEDLQDKIATLSISDIFSQEEIDNCIFLTAMGGDTLIDDFAHRINELTFADVFKDTIFEDPNDPSTIKSNWKYLLTDENGEVRLDYKIATDMECLIENMERNFQNATLSELYNDGLVSLSDPSVLEKNLLGHKVGDLTIQELLELAVTFAM